MIKIVAKRKLLNKKANKRKRFEKVKLKNINLKMGANPLFNIIFFPFFTNEIVMRVVVLNDKRVLVILVNSKVYLGIKPKLIDIPRTLINENFCSSPK